MLGDVTGVNGANEQNFFHRVTFHVQFGTVLLQLQFLLRHRHRPTTVHTLLKIQKKNLTPSHSLSSCRFPQQLHPSIAPMRSTLILFSTIFIAFTNGEASFGNDLNVLGGAAATACKQDDSSCFSIVACHDFGSPECTSGGADASLCCGVSDSNAT